MSGDWVLVSGGTGGIGKQLVARLATAGFRPAIGYRNHRDIAEQLARDCNGEAIALDLLNHAQIDAATAWFEERSITALILNASPPPTVETFRKMPSASFEEQFFPSVIGNHRLLSGVIDKGFRRRKTGTVVGVLTKAMGDGDTPAMKQVSSYIAAKYGLLGLLRAAQAEYAWLRVEMTLPGFTDTPMLDAFDPRYVALLREQQLLADPDTVAAEIVRKIVSDAAA